MAIKTTAFGKQIDRLAAAAASLLESGASRDDGDARTLLRSIDELLSRMNIEVEDGKAAPEKNDGPLVFDISDLLGYFPYNRAPTGIQRVQMEVIGAFITGQDMPLRLCRFDKVNALWVQVPSALFLELCAASKQGGSAEDPDWLHLYARVDAASRSTGAITFPQNGVLINLGTSWWLPDYFMHIRQLKTEFGIRYVPLIYDMIPAIRPEYCSPDLVVEFVEWLLGVLVHSDYFLAISQASKTDLIDLAATLGITIAPEKVGVVPLDADYRAATPSDSAASAQMPGVPRPFVLLVSTLETRKNQTGALDAWRALLNEYGPEQIPQLVLVGKRGHNGDQVAIRLSQDEALRHKVTVLSGLDDAALASLYRESLFVLYPSLYEGWGLPLTEALCYGKVPLAADNSSLPEAGGRYALYFQTGSPTDLLGKLRTLIFDKNARTDREADIARSFAPRSWTDIATQIHNYVSEDSGTGTPALWTPPLVHGGTYYPIRRRSSAHTWKGLRSTEIFRSGVNWHSIEDWGCWSMSLGGEIAFTVEDNRTVKIAIDIRGLPNRDCTARLLAEDGTTLNSVFIRTNQNRWIITDVPPIDRSVRLRLVADLVGNVAEDPRRFGIGLRGIFVFSEQDANPELTLAEAVALGCLEDYNPYLPIS